jgi:hypothetical protein
MSLAGGVLRDGALRAVPGGCEISVHLGWYRSLPLSSISRVEVAIDGRGAPPGDMTFRLNGRAYALHELAGRWQDWWFVLDAATLRISGATVRPGASAEVSVTLGWRIPYIIIGPQTALTHLVRVSRTLVAAEEET